MSIQKGTLNVKDPEVYRLAQAIAEATGETMTRVVKDALRERFQKLENQRSKASLDELMAIARRAAANLKGPYEDHGSLLYGDDGLPR